MEATTTTSQTLPVGNVWHIGVTTEGIPSILVTDPAGEPVVPALVADSAYEWTVTADVPGLWVASVSATGGAQHFRLTVSDLIPLPTLADLRGADPDREDPEELGYLGDNSFTDAQIQDALNAETLAQARVCSIPALYSADLREALMRRVAVNLARRGLPLMVLRGDAEAGNTVPPGRDSEVRRLEATYRRLVMG